MIYTVDTIGKTIWFKVPVTFKAIIETVESVFGSDNSVRVFKGGEEVSLLDCRIMAGTIKNPRQSNVK